MKYTKRKTATTTKPKAFAKAVMNIVNKKSEVKTTTVQSNGVNITSGAWNTYNLVRPSSGTNSATRVGNKIFIKSIRISIFCNNMSLTNSVSNTDGFFRLVCFRGKYDYLATNYPVAEIFEADAGTTPTNNMIARIDTHQVWPLLDKHIHVKGQAANVGASVKYTYTLPVNKTYIIREDDTFGGFANLYLGILYDNPIGALTTGSYNFQTSVNYTDV